MISTTSAQWQLVGGVLSQSPGWGRGLGQWRQRTRTGTAPDQMAVHVHGQHDIVVNCSWCAPRLTWLGSGGGAMAAEDTYWNRTSSTGSTR